MSYRRSGYGRRPVRTMGRGRRLVARRGVSRAYRRIMPRMRTLSRFPAGLSGGRGATEMKSVDSALVVAYIYNAAPGVVVQPPINGAAFYERIGTRTRAVSLEIRGKVYQSNLNVAGVHSGFGRIMIIYDRQPNGAVPQPNEILADYAYDGTTTSTSYAGLNMNNRDRFLVLRDRKFHLPAVGPLGVPPVNATPAAVVVRETITTDTASSFVFNEFIKLNGLETHYKSSLGGIGDISTGSILILLANSADAATPAAYALNYSARLKFFD